MKTKYIYGKFIIYIFELKLILDKEKAMYCQTN